MPDPAKFAKLLEVGYVIQPCCALCRNFVPGYNDWGSCNTSSYEHTKHTGERLLGVHRMGCCCHWSQGNLLTVLGSYTQLLDHKKVPT